MSPKELLVNACAYQMNINITKVDVVPEESIQYYYESSDKMKYFLRIDKFRLIHGTISPDGKSYASGLPIGVISYLIENFSNVNFYEMQA